jgi:hypothetical protein
MMLAAPETTAWQAMAATFAAPNWTEKTIAVPALGIYADHSAANDPTYFRKIFPNGGMVEVPGTGHFVMMEKPAEFKRLLAEFLPKLTSKGTGGNQHSPRRASMATVPYRGQAADSAPTRIPAGRRLHSKRYIHQCVH